MAREEPPATPAPAAPPRADPGREGAARYEAACRRGAARSARRSSRSSAQELSLLYVDGGYLNSGAILPDQDVRGGVVHYEIVEGRLSGVDIAGNRWFRSGYLRSRILRGAGAPLDVADLEQELQLLQQDPRIRRVDAELLPGERPGEARLRASFEEELPFFASLEQFSLGGFQTVRGYREHTLVRDNGLASSLELRIPLGL